MGLGDSPMPYMAPPVVMYRVGNGVAHHLAKLANSKQLNKVWVDSYLNCLVKIVNAEQLISNTQ